LIHQLKATLSGVLIDNAKGMFAYDTVYHDNDADQIETLPPTQLHRNVDLAIVKADQEGWYIYVRFHGSLQTA
jgi:hypothetical protein